MTASTAAVRLRAAFGEIAATRMRDMPLCNPALTVDTVGFRDWDGNAVGVLITPWCMNLVCLPGDASAWEAAGSGTTRALALPSGDYDFLHAEEDTLGAYLTSSLFSPMFEFADMAGARAVAEAVLEQIFTPAAPAEPETPLTRPISRRGFLGAFLPRDPKA